MTAIFISIFGEFFMPCKTPLTTALPRFPLNVNAGVLSASDVLPLALNNLPRAFTLCPLWL